MNILYFHPYSQHSRRVIALLKSAEIDYEGRPIALEKGEHMADSFLAVNPNHQVPVLDTPKVTLYESHAILRYLCQKYELKDWYPEGAESRAQVDQWLDWNQTQLAASVIGIVLNTLFMGDKGDTLAIEQGHEKIKILVPVLEQQLKDKIYLLGDQPTLADLSLGSNFTQLQLAKAFPESALIKGWYERVSELPGFKASLPEALLVQLPA